MKQRLDTYELMPSGMAEYLSFHGWHFSKKMCEWAVSQMKCKDETSAVAKTKKLDAMKKEEVDDILRKNGIKLENDSGYDACYVANMCKADYYKRSIADEAHLALFVKDYIDDVDAYDGMPFTRFYADCIGSGNCINWEEMI